ncbi:Phospholipase D beta 1 [Phytophthora ramorum]|uniref:Phospholipase D beta 1 n=1 Tax=Phytophthora ramorum TaxID=164328 RepID=UPI0030B7E466|nr:Phospholipase D beta 1 [Phytophthora ramorum]
MATEDLSRSIPFFPDPQQRANVSDKNERASFEQPVLEPDKWFLTAKEMRTARDGFERPSHALFTTGNHVKIYAASAGYFSDVADDIAQVRERDLVYMTGWSVCNVPFKPLEEKTTLHELVKGAVTRGADVRMLMWSNLTERKQVLEVRGFVNALSPPEASGPARFVFDDRLPHSTSSHHQKSVVIRKGRELVAYVGGVDLTSNRWDTLEHDQHELRQRAGIERKNRKGWLDAHARIIGPATKDVATNFLARWNSEPKPSQDLIDDLLDFENPDFSALPSVEDVIPLLVVPEDGSHAVQFVCTYSPDYDGYTDFAPMGEQSILHARIKAIRNARNYIFIQDQYFILVPELLDVLLEVMPSITRLVVIVQRTVEASYTGYDKYLYDMVSPLLLHFPDKFQLYTTKESRGLYIHSKVVIVDDVYVSLGSANWNRRSMTSDTELGINVVDTEHVQSPDGVTVNKLAREFRLQKFVEATKLPYAKFEAMTFIEACSALDAAARDDGFSLVETYTLGDKTRFDVEHIQRQIVDPEDSLGSR